MIQMYIHIITVHSTRYLELAITPDVVRKQDAPNVLSYIGKNPVGEPLTWDFLREKWTYIHDR